MPTARDRDFGKQCRLAFGELHAPMRGGSFYLSNCCVIFPAEKVYVAYAAIPPLWFYGISQGESESWENDQSLAFVLRDADGARYALLNANEAVTLLGKCPADDVGQKKIHIRRPVNSGQIYFVEWKDFRLSDRLQRLNVSLT